MKQFTTNLPTCIDIVLCYEPWIFVCPPDFQPIDFTWKRFYSSMQPQTKPSPLVMLILRPHVINTSCPKTPPLECTSAALVNLLWFYLVQKSTDNFTKWSLEEIITIWKICTHHGTRTPCFTQSDFWIASAPRSGNFLRISWTWS